jgi:hypothetical protein
MIIFESILKQASFFEVAEAAAKNGSSSKSNTNGKFGLPKLLKHIV